MNGQIRDENAELVAKIARPDEERGWNQEDFARKADLNRQTARRILLRDVGRKLRNVTIGRCARALGLPVDDLRYQPLERLLSRAVHHGLDDLDPGLRRAYDQATQPELQTWLERNAERASRLSDEELDELYSLQGTGGPLTRTGVEHFVALLERRRRLLQQVRAISGTEYLDVLEKVVALMYEKIQPYKDGSETRQSR